MKKIVRIGAIALIAFAAIGVMSCDWIVSLPVEGNVVNARAEKTATDWYKDKASGTTLVGAVVTFTNLSDNSTTTATVDSTGKYYVSLSAGKYSMTGKQTGWVFVPRVVELSGFLNTIPDFLAYVNPGNDKILLITEWQERTIDVDMHTVIDDNDYDSLDPDTITPEDVIDTVRFNTGYTDLHNVKLERDITSTELAAGLPAVETVLISANPFTDTRGWLRLYLHAWTDPTGNLTGNSYASTPVKDAKATVHVMMGEEHYGTFRIATETQEEAICVLKIKAYPVTGGTSYDIMSPGNFYGAIKAIE